MCLASKSVISYVPCIQINDLTCALHQNQCLASKSVSHRVVTQGQKQLYSSSSLSLRRHTLEQASNYIADQNFLLCPACMHLHNNSSSSGDKNAEPCTQPHAEPCTHNKASSQNHTTMIMSTSHVLFSSPPPQTPTHDAHRRAPPYTYMHATAYTLEVSGITA